MHTPRPYGLGVDKGQPTTADLLFIDACVKKLTNYKSASQVDAVKYVRSLPDGGYVIIYSVYELLKAIVVKDDKEKEVLLDGEAKFDVPMLFSGIFKKTEAITANEGVEIKTTKTCGRRLNDYDSSREENLNLELMKFKVPYPWLFSELKPEVAENFDPNELMFTQYGGLRATWYSGSMAEVVQIVSGFGIQDISRLPKDEDFETKKMIIPPRYVERIEREIGSTYLPGYFGAPNEDGYIEYSYKFSKTNLIGFDNNDDPWLLQIDATGVWAMPLPIIPATATQAFREYVEEVGDDELLLILDKYKGIPSGETFPVRYFDAWRKAGVIIKICDTKDFYRKSGYSSACGWTCNMRATELANTCYEYERSYCIGYTYTIKLTLGAAKDRGLAKAKNVNEIDDKITASEVASYISALLQLKESQPVMHILKYKLRVLSIEAIIDRRKKKLMHRSLITG